MKPPDYRIRVSPSAVSVQHRVRRPQWDLWLLAPIYGLIIHFNGGFKIMADLVRGRDYVSLFVAFILNCLFILLFSWSWLIYSSGELFHCDLKELHTGKRRVWIRWRRSTFTKESVSKLERASRGSSKTRYYTVLTFQVAGKRKDILEDLSLADAVRVLEACKSMGYDCILPEVFLNYDGPMMADIDKRGWFVNPWRPDTPQNHPTEQ